MNQPTLEKIVGAIAWTDSPFETMNKIIIALAELAKRKGATEEEIANTAAESVGYKDSK